MLMNLTPGLNFINILGTAFTLADPESVKRYLYDLAVLFTLLRSTSVKAEHKMLMKLTPGLNFINVLHTAFMLAEPKSVKKTVKSSLFLCVWDLGA